MSGSLTDRGSKVNMLENSISPVFALRKWAVLVDGSSVSAKAFDAACLFVTVQVFSQLYLAVFKHPKISLTDNGLKV